MRYLVFLLLISINTITLSAKSKIPAGVDLRDSLVRYAKTLINTPYRSGSKNGNGFDCSGYTSYVYRKFGMTLNGSSGSQVSNGKEVDIDNLKKGDLVFFKGHNSKTSRIGHVGIFLSHNPDGSFNFIHSANGGGVRIDNSNAGYYAKRYVTGCTVIPEKKKLYKFDPVQVKSFYESDNEVLYASTGKVHKVKKGESLYTIAKEYNVSEDQLKEWNKLSDTKLKPGQKLSIQSGKNSEKSKNSDSKATSGNRAGETHVVKKGESFYSIAHKYHISEEELVKANPAIDGKLKAGDKIQLIAGNATLSKKAKTELADEGTSKTVTSKKSHKVRKGETLSAIADKYGVSVEQLKRWNGISGKKLKPGSYITVQMAEKEVPVKESRNESVAKSTKKENSATEEQATKTVISKKSHKVRKGETLSAIADKYGVSVEQLKRWNGISGKKLKPGSYLTVQMTEKEVPVKEGKNEIVAKATKKENSATEGQATKTVTSKKSHKVRKGETLSAIADKYGVSVEQLKRWNGISGKKLKPGSYLTVQMTEKEVPVKESRNESVAKSTKKENSATEEQATKTVASKKSHKVRRGETLSAIADKYGVSVEQLKRWNGISGKKLKPGSYLTVQMTEKEVPVKESRNESVAKSTKKENSATEEQATKTVTSKKSHKVRRGETLSAIADKYGVSVEQLKRWNGISGKKPKPGSYLTVQMTEKEVSVKENKSEIVANATKKGAFSTEEPATKTVTSKKSHKVRRGETLSSLADKYGVSVEQLKRWNGISGKKLKPGSYVTVQMTEKEVSVTRSLKSQEETRPETKINPSEKKHIVAKGETLYSIARSHHISALKIKEWNNLTGYQVHVGDTLIFAPKTSLVTEKGTKPVNDTLHVQQTAAQPQAKESEQEPNVKPVISTTPVADKIDTLFTSYKVNKTHVVQDGETLESIAELYQVTPAQIKAWNGLSKRRSNVTVGQKITIETVQKEYVLVAAKKKRPATKGKITQEPAKVDEPEPEPSAPAKPVETKYVVKKGETLFSIAKTTNLTVDQLKEYNHLFTTDVKEGTTLSLVPDSTTATSKKSETTKAQTTEIGYTVKPGDTLTSIAKAYNVSVDELKTANEIESGEVNIGQHLQIPVH
jgi:LysM repeat protein